MADSNHDRELYIIGDNHRTRKTDGVIDRLEELAKQRKIILIEEGLSLSDKKDDFIYGAEEANSIMFTYAGLLAAEWDKKNHAHIRFLHQYIVVIFHTIFFLDSMKDEPNPTLLYTFIDELPDDKPEKGFICDQLVPLFQTNRDIFCPLTEPRFPDKSEFAERHKNYGDIFSDECIVFFKNNEALLTNVVKSMCLFLLSRIKKNNYYGLSDSELSEADLINFFDNLVGNLYWKKFTGKAREGIFFKNIQTILSETDKDTVRNLKVVFFVGNAHLEPMKNLFTDPKIKVTYLSHDQIAEKSSFLEELNKTTPVTLTTNEDIAPLRAPGAPGFMPPAPAAAKGAVAKGVAPVAAGAK